ncbi:type II toxin-antitoxin system Phd/YefM family antitoxin [Anaerovorax odorimutans]|uniref:Antitoxin n=1 Tax=Anaerovorax odorimutans TaxID=109327 RepID=A0ABT1RMS5_9FIRM|nr:type II toxin-antitoxin system Phd/YefM family antitoxin [Anaerovorax odorimutans]MCQ4636487.1 type II toxin-antitoxin system Phd/YefM family antitoxin [Anaerovorax odorimutans]
MINIRPVSDLRNNFTEIESIVREGEAVYLTKNGYGSMVVLSLEQYAALTEDVELKLDEADKAAAADATRFTANEVFGRVRERMNGSEKDSI